jgi:hypothetical protein
MGREAHAKRCAAYAVNLPYGISPSPLISTNHLRSLALPRGDGAQSTKQLKNRQKFACLPNN